MKVHYDAPDIERNFADRVLTLPISEDGNTNFAVGLALGGMVPVVDIITADFMLRSFDSICNTAAKLEHVSEAKTMVIKGEFLTGGPTTGQRVEPLFCRVPGLNVGVPSTPEDAEAMMLEALQHRGVTILFEEREIPDEELRPIDVHWTHLPGYCGLGARLRNENFDSLTVVSYGRTLHMLRQARFPCELIDLRWLEPLDIDLILASVSRTSRLLLVEPGSTHMGIGAEIVARMTHAVPGLRALRIGAERVPIPVANANHARLLPTIEQIRELANFV
jgi:pyruvate/2-oxoglutarate/acetoin dehydrogenase E1 component